ncbi:MAG: ABC transporter substrate-binding protein [Microbacterium sp.]
MSHHRARRVIGAVAAVTAAALIVTGCSGASDDTEDKTLYVLTSATEVGFDPATAVDLPTTWLGLVGRRLTTWKVSEGGVPEVVPDLATDTGTVSDDGLTWTYTLKDGITYEDGTPITSADIKYGVERTYAPELAGGLTYHVGLIEGDSDYTGPYDGDELSGIETPDDKTIIFHLTTPYGDWPWITAMNPFIPVPEDKDDPATYGTDPVASGPYEVESNKAGGETVLVRNPEWSADTDDVRTIDADKIVFTQNQNLTTTTQSLIADLGDARNSINSDPLSATELALVDADPSASDRLIRSDGGLLNYLALNVDRDALKDVKVRQAVEYAIDRKSLVIAAGGDEAAAAATTLIDPGLPGHTDFDLYPTDVDKAKSLLTEAGYPDGVTLELWASTSDSDQAQAQAIQQSLAQANITVNIHPLDFATMYGDVMGGNPDYDLLLSWFTPDYASASSLQLRYDTSMIDGGSNFSRYSNPDVDDLMAQAIAESDPDAAAGLWSQAEKQILGDAVTVPLFYTRSAFLEGSNVTAEVPAYPSFQNYLTIQLDE